MSDFTWIHPPGFRMFHRQGETAFPIIHPVIRTDLAFRINHCLGKTPNFPLQILSQTSGMYAHGMMLRLKNHGLDLKE